METSLKTLSLEQQRALLETLSRRFEKNLQRHAELKWEAIQPRLETNPEKLWSLNEMARSHTTARAGFEAR